MEVTGYAVESKEDKFHVHKFQRREVGDNDVLIKIIYCGICHSDIHTARSEWGPTMYPLVPGHEIVGKVEKVGANVKKFVVGDIAGVGCFVDSCGECKNCKNHEEMSCDDCSWTYNSNEQDFMTPTNGGYSTHIVVKESYTLKVSPSHHSDLSGVGPLLCAGITTYSPLMAWKHKVQNKKIGVVGLGGLGHMAVKIATAMGAEVTVFSTSPAKKDDAIRLGAKHFVVSKDEAQMKAVMGSLGLILNTVSSKHDPTPYLASLETHGVLIYVGISPDPITFNLFSIIAGNKSIVGAGIGGIKETQEMLDFCAAHNIVSDIELIAPSQIDEAYERVLKSDVKFRFVIDNSKI
eukprot:TRINITY_DN6119_c0_g1_i2.p1 TRINITY_DN6119_c0_g1~~TRINITY_DN6119_c0_g1_i2.p1  ORF type:complete len:349 (+),score=82.64 TRINITY_DN6119_c0_g1_i2:53-1099(+)